MGLWGGLNRRKFPRISYPCLVIIKNGQNEKLEALLTHTENVGIGGVSVTLKENVKIFSEVSLELDLLDLQGHIQCQGKVVWNVQRRSDAPEKPLFYDIGIEFQNLSDKEQNRLEEVINHLVKQQKKLVDED